MTLIQDHAVQQFTQTSEVNHQVASLQRDVLDMSRDLKEVLSEGRPDPALRAALEDLTVRLEQLGKQVANGNVSGIDELHQKYELEDIPTFNKIKDFEERLGSTECIQQHNLPATHRMA